MIDNIFISEQINNKLKFWQSIPPQSILLNSKDRYLLELNTNYILSKLFGTENINEYPHKLIISLEDKLSIGIDKTKEINKFLKLKIPSKRILNRFIVINQADRLTLEAQNTLLKVLEEPNKDTLFILNTSLPQSLLPTIRSRVELIVIPILSREKLKIHFSNVVDEDFNKAYQISKGNFREIIEYLDNNNTKAIDLARDILSGNQYQKIIKIDELSKDKKLSIEVLKTLNVMAETAIKYSSTNTKVWQNVLETSYQAEEDISKNVQLKLVLLNTLINL